MDIKSETDRIQSFVDRGNYHAAINSGAPLLIHE